MNLRTIQCACGLIAGESRLILPISSSISDPHESLKSKFYCVLHAQVGDTLPSIELQEGVPNSTVNVKELFAGKKGILFAVPGAFTPGCSMVSMWMD